MFGNRFSSSTSCSRWLHELAPGRVDPSLCCRFLKVATHLVKQVFTEPDLALPQRGLVGLALVPPELGAVGHERTSTGGPSLIFVDQRDAATEQALHLIAEPGLLTPVTAAGAVDPERPHKLGERAAKDQFAALGPHRFGR